MMVQELNQIYYMQHEQVFIMEKDHNKYLMIQIVIIKVKYYPPNDVDIRQTKLYKIYVEVGRGLKIHENIYKNSENNIKKQEIMELIQNTDEMKQLINKQFDECINAFNCKWTKYLLNNILLNPYFSIQQNNKPIFDKILLFIHLQDGASKC